MIDVIVPCYNRLARTQDCIRHIQENTWMPHRLILVNDGSTDGTGEYLDGLENVTVVHNEQNRGFPAAVNQGLALVEGSHVAIVHNDVQVPQGWASAMVAELDAKPYLGALQANVRDPSGAMGTTETVHRPTISFFCAVLKSDVVQQVGVLDEQFSPCYGADDDHAIRIRRLNYEVGIFPEVWALRLRSKDNGSTPEREQAVARLRRKWGKRVYVAILHQGDMRPELANRLQYMTRHPLHEVSIHYPNARPIANNRNQICKAALASGKDVLLMIDDDVTPNQDPLDLVVLDKDVIGLPCPVWNEGDIYINVMKHVPEEEGFRPINLFDKTPLYREQDMAVGAGAMLIQRRVLERVKAPFERRWDEDGIQTMGLDFSFCLKAQDLGFEVWTHKDHICGHFARVNLVEVLQLLTRGM